MPLSQRFFAWSIQGPFHVLLHGRRARARIKSYDEKRVILPGRSSCLWNRWSDRFARIPSSKVTMAVVVVNRTHLPAVRAAKPRAVARWVLPVPGLPTSSSFFALVISFCLMPELTAQQFFSGCWPSLRCAAPAAFAYFSDLNRP
jgi:hypothetical protein